MGNILMKNVGAKEATNGQIVSKSFDANHNISSLYYHVSGAWDGATAVLQVNKYGHEVWLDVEQTRVSADELPLILDLRYGCQVRVIIDNVGANTSLTVSL